MHQRRRFARIAALVLVAATAAVGCQPRFTIVGDSITFDAREEFEGHDAEVHAFGGVTIQQGRPKIHELADAHRQVLVIALGRMDLSYGVPVREVRHRMHTVMRQDIDGARCVIWLDLTTRPNLLPFWPERAGRFNADLRDLAARYGVSVAAWSRVSHEHPEWFRRDLIHLRPLGQRHYAAFVARQADRLC